MTKKPTTRKPATAKAATARKATTKTAAAKKPAAKKAAPKKAAAAKSAAPKTAARKVTAKTATAKKAAPKKTAARKAAVKKAPAKKAPAPKTAAKKTVSKKAAAAKPAAKPKAATRSAAKTTSRKRYDTVLTGGRVIDPASGLDKISDVAIKNGRIAAVRPKLAADAETVMDATGLLVVPGLIDTHAHVYQYVSGRFGLNPDLCGVRSGVTTLIDQGGPSCMTFPGFRHFIAEPANSNVLAFISIYEVGGLEGHYYPDLYGPNCIDVKATVRAAKANADMVKGIKAHAEVGGMSRWGLETLKLAREAGDKAGLPIYVHLGQLWPEKKGAEGTIDIEDEMPEIVALLKEGDVLAHPFTRHPGGFVSRNGRVHPVIEAALDRGLRVDVGHGSHFSFAMARQVLAAGIKPFTIGADMHGYNTRVPPEKGTPKDHPDDEMHLFAGQTRFSLCHAMTELMAMGVPLTEVIEMATSNCAIEIGMEDTLGSLARGRGADISVLRLEEGKWTLRDNSGDSQEATERLVPVFCLREGVRYEADSPILPH